MPPVMPSAGFVTIKMPAGDNANPGGSGLLLDIATCPDEVVEQLLDGLRLLREILAGDRGRATVELDAELFRQALRRILDHPPSKPQPAQPIWAKARRKKPVKRSTNKPTARRQATPRPRRRPPPRRNDESQLRLNSPCA